MDRRRFIVGATLTLLAAPLGAEAEQAPVLGTTLGIAGTKFTINNAPTFLLGVNYYDVLSWRVRDLDGFVARKINLCRIWMASPTTWINTGGLTGRTALTAAGDWVDSAKRDTIIAFVDACAARGIVCDVVIQDSGSALDHLEYADGPTASDHHGRGHAGRQDELHVRLGQRAPLLRPVDLRRERIRVGSQRRVPRGGA